MRMYISPSESSTPLNDVSHLVCFDAKIAQFSEISVLSIYVGANQGHCAIIDVSPP